MKRKKTVEIKISKNLTLSELINKIISNRNILKDFFQNDSNHYTFTIKNETYLLTIFNEVADIEIKTSTKRFRAMSETERYNLIDYINSL